MFYKEIVFVSLISLVALPILSMRLDTLMIRMRKPTKRKFSRNVRVSIREDLSGNGPGTISARS